MINVTFHTYTNLGVTRRKEVYTDFNKLLSENSISAEGTKELIEFNQMYEVLKAFATDYDVFDEAFSSITLDISDSSILKSMTVGLQRGFIKGDGYYRFESEIDFPIDFKYWDFFPEPDEYKLNRVFKSIKHWISYYGY